MTWTLVVMGHGRWNYMTQALDSLDLGAFDRHIMAVDGPLPDALQPSTWEVLSTGTRQGLTANMTQALAALSSDDEWVFWVEEDFVIGDAPLEEMAKTLDAYRNVANMVLLRQPWGAHEIRAGSVLAAQNYDLTDRGGWLEHRGGFWLNPFVAHASLLRSLTPGVETDLTNQCLARGLSFGYWGGVDDPPRCTHIGAENGMGSQGWKS